jgi:AcrR family transcriptional regulator
MAKGQHEPSYRQRLIAALAVVIARDGFGGAKIQDVVREAKVSLRTFYAEFPNKETAFLELYAIIGRNLEKVIVDAVDLSKPWHSQMESGFRAYLTALAVSPKLTYAGLVELATLSDEARVARQDSLERFVALICDQIEQGRIANPDIPSRPVSPMMARALLGGVTEMMIDLVVRGEAERLPELVDVATDLMWSVVTNVAPVPANALAPAANTPKSGVEVPEPSTEPGVRR